jgi:SAM-dependent methyltransferase
LKTTNGKLKKTPQARSLDMGCGSRKRHGCIGIDNNRRSDADVIHDLNSFPYPFKKSSFDEIFADNVIEHLSDVIATLEEIHRISASGALVKITVPYFRSRWAFIDPTHLHYFTVDSFAYFDAENPISERYKYSDARFSVEKIIFNEQIPCRPIRRFVKLIANKWPRRYEHYLSHLYPLDDITYYLRALK